ncbi:phage gene 29 protein family protein [Nocardia sp. NPDC001965]
MIPTQETYDWDDPEERVVWALRNLPNVGGVAQIVHPSILRAWSKHIDELAFIHVDRLKAMANEDGFIHVSQLPEQQKEFHPAVRGPRHDYNPGAQWVAAGTPKPEPTVLPDITQLTAQENEAMIAQYYAHGYIPRPGDGRDSAQELN